MVQDIDDSETCIILIGKKSIDNMLCVNSDRGLCMFPRNGSEFKLINEKI